MINIDIRIRRLLALLVDIFVIVVLGASFGIVLGCWLIYLGRNAQIVGLIIAVMYHGLTNSLLLSGQTLGKILFKLKVVLKSGDRVNTIRSLLRSLSFIVFFFFNDPSLFPDNWDNVVSYVSTPFAVALVYFTLLFPGYRSAHDYLFGTYVVESNDIKFDKYNISVKNVVIVVLLSAVIIVYSLFISSSVHYDVEFAKNLKKTYVYIKFFPDVLGASIKLEENKYSIGVQITKPPFENHKLAVQAACNLINNLNLTDSNQQIQTKLMRGYDIKIYRSWEVYENTLSVSDWEKEKAKYPNNH